MRVLLHTPLKPPDSPTPSGDREMARGLARLLHRLGHVVTMPAASRMTPGVPASDTHLALERDARRRAARLIARWKALPAGHRERFDLWFTYHCYYRKPDWLGPIVTRALGIPYEIDGSLYDREREPRFMFRFDIAGDDPFITCAHGGRYDEYVTRLTGRRENATVQTSITFNGRPAGTTPAPTPAPRAYLVHLGWRAKLHGFSVVDILRQAGIPAAHVFDATRLSPQMDAAQRLGTGFIVIMGEREARDRTVILRRLSDNSQETVSLQALPKIVKRWAK